VNGALASIEKPVWCAGKDPLREAMLGCAPAVSAHTITANPRLARATSAWTDTTLAFIAPLPTSYNRVFNCGALLYRYSPQNDSSSPREFLDSSFGLSLRNSVVYDLADLPASSFSMLYLSALLQALVVNIRLWAVLYSQLHRKDRADLSLTHGIPGRKIGRGCVIKTLHRPDFNSGCNSKRSIKKRINADNNRKDNRKDNK
jgi:hypothetical protein